MAWKTGGLSKVIEMREGHVLEVLGGMEAGSVQCCVTSPPYWGLRDYGLEPVVWDGDPECEHQWGKTIHGEPVCRLCGAWRGSLGLEPTVDCGRPLVELRDDLTEKERQFVIQRLEEAGLV